MTQDHDDLVARLERRRVERTEPHTSVHGSLVNPDGPEAADLIRKLTAERDEARAALTPFAQAADSLDEHHSDGDDIWEFAPATQINAGHLRQARSLTQSDEGR